MGEHSVELIGLMGTLSGMMAGVVWFLLKRDRKQIDRDLHDIRTELADSMKIACAKIDGVRELATLARDKALGLERNYLDRFAKVHEHLNEIEKKLLQDLAGTRELMLERFVTKAEADTAHSHIRNEIERTRK